MKRAIFFATSILFILIDPHFALTFAIAITVCLLLINEKERQIIEKEQQYTLQLIKEYVNHLKEKE